MIVGHPLEKVAVVLIIPVVVVQALVQLPPPLGVVEMLVVISAGSRGVAVLQRGAALRQEGLRGGAVFPGHLGQAPRQVGRGGQSVALSPQDLVGRSLHWSAEEALVPGDEPIGAVGGG